MDWQKQLDAQVLEYSRNEEYLPLLESYRHSPNPRVQEAAHYAINSIHGVC